MEAAARRKSLRSAQRGSGGGSSSKAKRRLSHVLSPPAAVDAVPGATLRKEVRRVTRRTHTRNTQLGAALVRGQKYAEQPCQSEIGRCSNRLRFR